MLGFQEVIEHLKDTHGLLVDKNQERDLQNIGYYHGYKGYRFIQETSNRIAFTSFSQVVTLNRFDMRLKSILYQRLMFIETALKSYVIEAVLADCGSEDLSDHCIFSSIPGFRRNVLSGSRYTPSSSKWGLTASLVMMTRVNASPMNLNGRFSCASFSASGME